MHIYRTLPFYADNCGRQLINFIYDQNIFTYLKQQQHYNNNEKSNFYFFSFSFNERKAKKEARTQQKYQIDRKSNEKNYREMEKKKKRRRTISELNVKPMNERDFLNNILISHRNEQK